ncbi:MAG: outer membrane lipoprotein-sorting protein [Syntrophobacteraceae bacterium]
MKSSRIAVICLICFLGVLFNRHALADVSPGDVIDKSNYQKVEGMVPQSIITWLKNGQLVLNISKLNYSPGEFNKQLVGEKLLKENTGKYAIKDSQIVDGKTGGEPGFIAGIPFPNLDPKDPDAGIKLQYNRDYLRFNEGNIDVPCHFQFIQKTGFEREAKAYYYQYPFEGYPQAKDRPNPEKLLRYNMYVFREPYDVAGTSMMCWRYRRESQDQNFAYVPSIRRVRRLTPANRSDSIVGSDICWDDAMGYDGKPDAMEWKVVKYTEALLPFLSENPQKFVKDPDLGGWMTTKDIKAVDYGYEKPEWTGAKWAPLNIIWVKRPCYVIETKAKDPYYNFGPQEIWMDAEVPHASFVRDITDRSGAYWKTMILGGSAWKSDNNEVVMNEFATMQTMDSRTGRATIVELASPRNIYHYFANSDVNKYSLAGYAAFCK